MFHDLISLMNQEELEIKAKFAVGDFESTPGKAIKSFLDIDIFGCYFHFKQAVIRNMPADISSAYNSNLVFQLGMKELFALAFLTAELIPDGFDLIQTKLMAAFQFTGLNPFLEYFKRTWVGFHDGQVKHQPLIQHKIWSVHTRTFLGIPRTTNHRILAQSFEYPDRK